MTQHLVEFHFTCGPSRTEAEHPQPGFGEVDFSNALKTLSPLECTEEFKTYPSVILLRILVNGP